MKEESPLAYAIKFAIVALFGVAVILALGVTFTSYMESKNSPTPLPVFDKEEKIRFVIDAGHGGEDAGAVAGDGTMEKTLNLEIAIMLKAVLELNGNQAVLTRDDDSLLYDYFDDLEDYTGQKKVYDLKNRLKIAQERENSVYVGIHMNKFSQEKYSGTQVYFSPNNDLSQHLAKDIRESVKVNLQPDNNRQIKRADSSIYILNRAEIPAVLIECGFLSNERELELLKSRNYQLALAINIFASLTRMDTQQ